MLIAVVFGYSSFEVNKSSFEMDEVTMLIAALVWMRLLDT